MVAPAPSPTPSPTGSSSSTGLDVETIRQRLDEIDRRASYMQGSNKSALTHALKARELINSLISELTAGAVQPPAPSSSPSTTPAVSPSTTPVPSSPPTDAPPTDSSQPSTDGVLFFDDFSSGDLSKTSDLGWQWGHTPGALCNNCDVSSEHSLSGGYSLKINYPAKLDGQDGMSEQRFFITSDPATAPNEIWIEYDIRVPDNYVHRSQTSSVNNKLLALWAESYKEGAIGAFWVAEAERYRDATGKGDQSYLQFKVFNGEGQHAGVSQAMTTKGDLFRFEDRGKWIHLQFHIRIGDLQGTPAISKAWRDGELIGDLPEDFIAAEGEGKDYFRKGYLFGWSNSGFSEDTAFYIDNFTIYDQDPGWEL